MHQQLQAFKNVLNFALEISIYGFRMDFTTKSGIKIALMIALFSVI
jgi:hypothetical protein